ncbi:hypothetical protein [Kocuria sp. TGY1127_2]|uniref:hypothetical protein n=1 Tax=Kocuria sp. TGY1127_2 TaxID=2711328 RepID=UPI0015BEC04B|nr:hypothetical protein [Kocuria sp. TGY1127_2]
MATLETVDVRNADNARAYGDSDTDVWLGRIHRDQTVQLPRSSNDLVKFSETHPPLGWLSEDGVPFDTDIDSEEFKGLQGSQIIKNKITQTNRSATIQALEESVRVGELYWDHGAPKKVAGSTNETIVDLPGSLKTLDCWAIFKFTDGENFVIYVWPHIQITDRGTLDHKNDDLSLYEMTAKFIGDGYMITNNADYAKHAEGTDGEGNDEANTTPELPAGEDDTEGEKAA